jgi:iron complex outermembrane receptor protein
LSLSTGYAYTDAQIREMADNSYMSSDATKGRQFQYIPKNTFYVYGDYVVTEGFLKNFGINFDVTYQDKVYRNSTNTTAFDSYWLTDAGISYRLKNNIGLRLNINNLFDKEYFNQALGNQYVPSMPRNFLATITYSL